MPETFLLQLTVCEVIYTTRLYHLEVPGPAKLDIQLGSLEQTNAETSPRKDGSRSPPRVFGRPNRLEASEPAAAPRGSIDYSLGCICTQNSTLKDCVLRTATQVKCLSGIADDSDE